jgi:hypothetical protein
MGNLTFSPDDHSYKLDGTPMISVTQALVGGGLVDTSWFTEWARDRGSAVHRAIQLYEAHDLDMSTIDEYVRPFFNGYLKFRGEYDWHPEHSELHVWSNRHQYAGTLDGVGKSRGIKTILDYKTGQLTKAVGIQLTGYALAHAECKHSVVTNLLGVRLVGDGTYRVQSYKLNPGVFYAALTIARWHREP